MGVVYACALSFMSKYLYQSCGPKHMTRVDINDNNQSSNTKDRYRGKLPLICFNCDGIGNFSNKCPHKKNRNDEGYSKSKKTYKDKRTTNKVFKKILCTKEDISSLDEDKVSGSETKRVLFMEVKDSDKEYSEDEYEEVEG
jgi:hypothetical protein